MTQGGKLRFKAKEKLVERLRNGMWKIAERMRCWAGSLIRLELSWSGGTNLWSATLGPGKGEQEGMEVLLQLLPNRSAQYNQIVAKLMSQALENGAATKTDSEHVSGGGGSDVEEAGEQGQDSEVEFQSR